MSPRIQKQEKDRRKYHSCRSSSKLALTVELRKKILVLRHIIDLPPCDCSLSIDKLMIKTMKDLHDLYPEILPIRLAEINGSVSTYQVLACFCNALQTIGEPPLAAEAYWIDNTKNVDRLVEHAIAVVDELIKKTSEKFDIMDGDDERRDFKIKANKVGKTLKEACSESSSTGSSITSVVSGHSSVKYPCSSPPMFTVRVQATGKLMPVELKQLAVRVLQNVGGQSPRISDQKQDSAEEPETMMPVLEKTKHSGAQNENPEGPISDMDDASNGGSNVEIIELLVPIPSNSFKLKDVQAAVATSIAQVLSPPSLAKPERNLEVEATRSDPGSAPQPPSVLQPNVGATGPLLPQPPVMPSEGLGALPLPPKPLTNRAGPPPPPPHGVVKSLRPKKVATKLKRSSHISSLYRVLKGKVEGCPLQGKSTNGRKGGVGSKTGGKQGLADALIEMTKRSAYFQQIEKDVQEHAKSVTELKVAISTFKTTNMTDLLNFHKLVESVLDKLTDETQVLAKFEGFPMKKLETLRMAATLYTKLGSILNELQNLKIEPPLSKLLQRVDQYFNKLKREIDAVERTKDEDTKKFQTHGIDFDFNIIIRIKEAMVDVSSNCMELILKERRDEKDSKTTNFGGKNEALTKVCAKMLWKFFQFAFSVYTFAGGHDDRADKLMREIANEIQIDPLQH